MRSLDPAASVWDGLLGRRKIIVEHVAAGEVPPLRKRETALILPLMEDHIAHCVTNFSTACKGLFPSLTALEVLRDKLRFADYLAANNLAHLAPQNYPDVSLAVFPCVLKRADLHASVGVTIANSAQHLRDLLREDPWHNRPYLLQLLIDVPVDYVTHCVCLAGRILWHCSFKYELGARAVIRDPWRKPVSTSTPEIVLAALQALLEPLSYTGPCNVDYKITTSGAIAVLEINPRLGGSLMAPENVAYLREALRCIFETALNQ